MSGKPAARITDSVSGSKIVSGSRTVLIGSQGGIACSECPGGVTVGSPVSPAQGAKILMGAPELDFALPGAMPLAWQRQYSSYVNPVHGAPCGLLGHGWSLPGEMRIVLRDDACILFTTMGRAITFDPLPEGGAIYSPSEDIWLLRGGAGAAWAEQPRLRHIAESLRDDPHCILATDGRARTCWVLAPAATSGEAPQEAAAEGSESYMQQCMLDRFGRRQTCERDAWGRVTGIVDGVGRRYRLHLRQLHAARPAQGPWHADSGWRLSGVELLSDPCASGTDGMEVTQEAVMLVRYGYSPAGDLVTVHDRAGRLVREFAWQDHRMTAHRHLGGPRHTYRYEGTEARARVVEHASEEGLSFRFAYSEDETGRTTTVTDSLQRIDVYRFEGEAGLSRLVEHVRADGSSMRHAYDTTGRLVESVDPLGRITRLRYDGEGRLLGSHDADGTHGSQAYDPDTGDLLSITDAAGAVTRFVYDAWGRRTQVVRADGSAQCDEYLQPEEAPLVCDLPMARTDARGGIVRFAWSPAGQLLRHTDCSGRTTEYAYDRWGRRIRHTDALGCSVRYDYDFAGGLRAVHRADGSTVRYATDVAGRVTQVQPREQQAGHTVGFAYDLWGRVTRRWQSGHDVQYEYDSAGRLVRLRNENGAQAHFTWDAMNRQVGEEGFDGRQQAYRYDAAGQLAAVVDGTGADLLCTRYGWDAMGRLTEIHVPATGHAASRVERLEWNAASQLVAARSYLAGPDGEPWLHAEALTERDALGRPVAETQRLYQAAAPALAFEHTISHKLDAMGHRESSALQDLGTVDYLLYGAGHLHGLLHDGRNLLDIERDALHREILRQHATPDGRGLQTHRAWNVLGRLDSLGIAGVLPPDDAAGSAPLSPAGLLSRRSYRYDDMGQLEAVEAEGHEACYRYDAHGRLVAARTADRWRHWLFDPAGNRLPSPEAAQRPSLQADDADQWTARVRGQWQMQGFDVLGQVQAPQADAAPAGVPRWPDNRVGHGDAAAYRYDGRGNRVEATGPDGRQLVLHYDGANRLVEARAKDRARTIVSRYLYDARGRRLCKTVAEQVHGQAEILKAHVYQGWDGDRLVHTELCKPGRDRQVVHTVYEPGGFTPLVRLSTQGEAPPQGLAALIADAGDPQMSRGLQDALEALPPAMRLGLEAGVQAWADQGMAPEAAEATRMAGPPRAVAVHHYHCDPMGTPQALTDESGRLVWMASYDPWGQLAQEYNPHGIDQPIRLPGQHLDAETGLHYNRHRYYDPALGAYINQDPIGLRGGLNGFAYARQDPLQLSDPLGLYADAAHAGTPLFDAPPGAGLPDIGSDLERPEPGSTKNCPDCTQVAGRVSDYATVCVYVVFLSLGIKLPPRPPPPPPPPISVQEQSLKGRGGKNCS